jgi:hypothetical protein
MENKSVQPQESLHSRLPSQEHTSAHDLVQKKIEDENFHVSEKQFEDIDTSITIDPISQREADELADNLQREERSNSAELTGE